MAFNKKKTAAVGIAAVMALGALAGCDLVSTDLQKDYEQVIAEVDITASDDFQAGGKYAAYADAIEPSAVIKRDLVASFMSVGYMYVESYGYSYADAYELIKNSLVNRAIYLQYAQVYFYESGEYSVSGYEAAVSSASEADKNIAGLAYFLSEEEIAKAEYDTKVSVNTTIDSLEMAIIDFEDEHDHEEARTTPTGVGTVNEDFVDPAYKIYTGSNSASDCGSYETVDESTPSTRTRAYKRLLSNLNSYGLIEKGENTSDVTSLSYYQIQRRNTYEDAVIDKLGEAFEDEAAEGHHAGVGDLQVRGDARFPAADVLCRHDLSRDGARQRVRFLLRALFPRRKLRFRPQHPASLQRHADGGPQRGSRRPRRCQRQQVHDARFPCSRAFAPPISAAPGSRDTTTIPSSPKRQITPTRAAMPIGEYLFFEDNLKKSEGDTAQYEPLKNYYGKYTYNGTVEKTEDEHGKTEFKITPAQLSIDGFLSEMKGYLTANGYTLSEELAADAGYYSKTLSDYYNEDGTVDYSSFVYYKANVNELSDFNANEGVRHRFGREQCHVHDERALLRVQHGYGGPQQLSRLCGLSECDRLHEGV